MTDFSAAMQPWIDADGLVGSSANPPKWSSGNAILDTSIACIYEVKINGRQADADFLKARGAAIAACQNPDGSFDKNPGRPDQITQDDLKGAAVLSRVCSMPFAREITKFGKVTKWVLSNTGFPYWTACAKPWDKAIYLISATESPDWLELAALCGAILVDAFWGNPGTNRLMWVSSQGFAGIYPLVDTILWFWNRRMRAKYATVGGMMAAYLPDGASVHPYVVYGRKIGF